ncbi:hypothetical protein TNCV_1411581 [Trichonephila clavipes]|nr:hypothetical protein TNCV_1411581 [Trichonephila clavipes]
MSPLSQKNVPATKISLARELTTAEGLASTENRFANGDHTEDGGAKLREQVPPNTMHPAFVLFGVLTIMMKLKDKNGCNVGALVHPGSMRNVSS